MSGLNGMSSIHIANLCCTYYLENKKDIGQVLDFIEECCLSDGYNKPTTDERFARIITMFIEVVAEKVNGLFYAKDFKRFGYENANPEYDCDFNFKFNMPYDELTYISERLPELPTKISPMYKSLKERADLSLYWLSMEKRDLYLRVRMRESLMAAGTIGCDELKYINNRGLLKYCYPDFNIPLLSSSNRHHKYYQGTVDHMVAGGMSGAKSLLNCYGDSMIQVQKNFLEKKIKESIEFLMPNFETLSDNIIENMIPCMDDFHLLTIPHIIENKSHACREAYQRALNR